MVSLLGYITVGNIQPLIWGGPFWRAQRKNWFPCCVSSGRAVHDQKLNQTVVRENEGIILIDRSPWHDLHPPPHPSPHHLLPKATTRNGYITDSGSVKWGTQIPLRPNSDRSQQRPDSQMALIDYPVLWGTFRVFLFFSRPDLLTNGQGRRS